MKLRELITGMPIISIRGEMPEEVTGITKDSRDVTEGSVFFATEASKRYAPEALKKGAAVIVSDGELSGVVPSCLILVENGRALLGQMAAKFFDFPSRHLHVTGITGTNGKTTTTYLIESLLHAWGRKAGIMGTITYRYDGHVMKGTTTTPESTQVQSLLAEMRKADVRFVAMEVSSHALDQGRVEGVDFDVVIFTNLTHDHLDYHHDFEHYRAAKQLLFQHYLTKSSKEKKYAILNVDDPSVGSFMPDGGVTTLTYSVEEEADACLLACEEDINGLRLRLSVMGTEVPVASTLVGMFNVSNILAAALFGYTVGMPPEAIRKGLEALPGVPGRLERVLNDRGIAIFIDYAHTPDALKKTLETLNAVRSGRLIVVFGCGGDRDRTKRPVMGRIASELSDFAIITSDNPRGEEPVAIIREIAGGFNGSSKYRVIENRKEAIFEAVRMARADDVLLIAGKGHEDYQIIGSSTLHFSDREAIEDSLHVAG